MNSVLKTLVAVASLVLLFACGGGGDETSATVNPSAFSEGRIKTLAAGIAPDSGALSNTVNSRFAQCMDTIWNSWFKPSKYAQCVGEGYRVLFEESGIGSQLTNKPHFWLSEKGRVTIGGNFILVQFKFGVKVVNLLLAEEVVFRYTGDYECQAKNQTALFWSSPIGAVFNINSLSENRSLCATRRALFGALQNELRTRSSGRYSP